MPGQINFSYLCGNPGILRSPGPEGDVVEIQPFAFHQLHQRQKAIFRSTDKLAGLFDYIAVEAINLEVDHLDMTRYIVIAMTHTATQAGARPPLLTASPIPNRVNARFCHSGGLACSKGASIAIGSGHSRTNLSRAVGAETSNDQGGMHGGGQVLGREDKKLLECGAGEDGVLTWSSVATVQLGR